MTVGADAGNLVGLERRNSFFEHGLGLRRNAKLPAGSETRA